jgi:hypothetical protein
MSNRTGALGSDAARMIIVPGLLTLAVTLLRLTGELRRWSAAWFSHDTGGIIPSGVSWIVGITWLAAIFGAYFALRLERHGRGPRSLGKAFLYAGIGIVIFLVSNPIVGLVHDIFQINFPEILIFIWLLWTLAGALQYPGWPDLFKVVLLYGYTARIPVAIVMFFAMRGNWGTHYDYVGMPPQFSMAPVPRYLWLAFFPQLVGWIGFTLTLGAAAGVLAIGLARLKRRPVPETGVSSLA